MRLFFDVIRQDRRAIAEDRIAGKLSFRNGDATAALDEIMRVICGHPATLDEGGHQKDRIRRPAILLFQAQQNRFDFGWEMVAQRRIRAADEHQRVAEVLVCLQHVGDDLADNLPGLPGAVGPGIGQDIEEPLLVGERHAQRRCVPAGEQVIPMNRLDAGRVVVKHDDADERLRLTGDCFFARPPVRSAARGTEDCFFVPRIMVRWWQRAGAMSIGKFVLPFQIYHGTKRWVYFNIRGCCHGWL